MRRLDEEEHAKLTKRAGLYQKKLDTMPDELDDKVCVCVCVCVCVDNDDHEVYICIHCN